MSGRELTDHIANVSPGFHWFIWGTVAVSMADLLLSHMGRVFVGHYCGQGTRGTRGLLFTS